MLTVNVSVATLPAIRTLEASRERLQSITTHIASGFDPSTAYDKSPSADLVADLRSRLSTIRNTQDTLNFAVLATNTALIAVQGVSDTLVQMKPGVVSLQEAKGRGDDTEAGIYRATVRQHQALMDFMLAHTNVAGIEMVNPSRDAQTVDSVNDGTHKPTLGFRYDRLAYHGPLVSNGKDGEGDPTVGDVNQSLDNVDAAAAHLGTAARSLEIDKAFTDKMETALTGALSDLEGEDVVKTASDFTQAQIKQQLGVTAFNIAKQSATAVLSLFGGGGGKASGDGKGGGASSSAAS